MSSRWSLADLSQKPALLAQVYPKPSTSVPAVKSPTIGPKQAKRAIRKNDESLSQQALIKWWAVACLEFHLPEELLMAYPLQSNRHVSNAMRMKREGLRRGTMDLQLQVSRGYCLTLCIEMKSPKGYLQPHQKKMLKMLTQHGHATVVARSTEEAIRAITAYLLMKPQP